jgi:glycyl-tRNA synthetase beta chain
MVYEFPELQGFMGEKYAAQKGEDIGVAKAINEHYMPRNAEDSLPETNAGAVLAVAEKMDTIASFFAIGNIPSGSQDPYALRRQATGIVQTLNHQNWNVDLEEIIEKALQLIAEAGIVKNSADKIEEELLAFFKLRIKHLLQERGIRYDVIDAVIGNKVGVIASLVRKADVLQSRLEEEGFKESMEALSRVLNISSKAEYERDIDARLFENDAELKLYNTYEQACERITKTIQEDEYYRLLVSMKESINDYFEHTMVMASNEKLRQNRLSLMLKLSQLIKGFANFNEIIVK